MSVLQAVLNRPRLIITLVVLFSLTGIMAWHRMERQEDPRLPEYWGQIVIPFPGASAEQVERLVLKPVEDDLAEVDEIHWIESTAFAEFAVVFVELRQDIRHPSDAWDDVRRALDRAQRVFPEGAGEAVLNDEVGSEQESVVLAVTGSPDPLDLLAAARVLKRELLKLPQVALVHLVADPGEQITIALDDSAARRLGTNAPELTAQLAGRNVMLPGGTIVLGDKSVSLRPMADFSSFEEISATSILLPSGVAVPLSEVARVRLGPAEPAASRMRTNGEMAVGLGVVAKDGTDLVASGRAVRNTVDRMQLKLAPLRVGEVTFQPQRVAARLDQLSQSLLLGIAIVAGVVIMVMGLRLGLLVASVVPLVALSSLAVFAFGGGVLHQISIAALVLALGMLVDNAIVIAESVQRRLDLGVPSKKAALDSVSELAVPLGGATATTLAAFVPMLLSRGPTAEFTRAIPVVVMLTLSVSYLFALFVTPVLSRTVLRPNPSHLRSWSDAWGRRLSGLAIRRPWSILVLAGGAVLASMAAGAWVNKEFFPAADRNQVVIDVKLPEGSHLDSTDQRARDLEQFLMSRSDVTEVASFIGRSAPKFYYNLARIPWSPHFAQLVVATRET